MAPMLCSPRSLAAIGRLNLSDPSRIRFPRAAFCLALIVVASSSNMSWADEGGVSFWLPGIFGSLAAAPQQPGWSLAAVNYYTNVSASGDVARAREFEIGKIPGNVSATLNANLNASGDVVLLTPSYTFATPVLGGARQPSG